jgi:nicotinamide-nucleotide amidase
METLCAELIAVGTELLLGSIANTDAQFLSRELAGLGISVERHTAVGDDPQRLREAVEAARARCSILITTGGLGPTFDDLTKQVVCRVFDRPLTLRPEVEETIEGIYRDILHRPMPESDRLQALLPEGAELFPNHAGTAPGFAFCSGGVHVLMLPGPPEECRSVWEHGAREYLRRLSPGVICSRDIMSFGMGESSVEFLLHEKMCRMVNPSLATYAKPSEVCLRATARANTAQEADALLDPVEAEVRAALGDLVYGVDVSGLTELCLQRLKARGLTLACAESCTGGLIAQRITALPGASAVFRGGVVSYWSSVKAGVLGVDPALLETHGAVSAPVAEAMAKGARAITGADLAVSVTGVAGPDSDERGNPVGRVFVALADETGGVYCRHLELGRRSRELIRDEAANHALDLLRRHLDGLPMELTVPELKKG